MPELCLFCDNNSGSREHVWPHWILERKDFGPIRAQRGKSVVKIIPSPQITVKTVCGQCNNGWMSALEAENIPLIGSMFQSIATPLDEAQQRLVAAWAVKTAMVTDSMKGRNAPNRFYKREECLKMRTHRENPPLTLVWIGRMDGKHLGNFGTDFTVNWGENNKRIGMGSAFTMVVGHFVTQVVTVHPELTGVEIPAVPCKMGNWQESLIQIWPITKPVINWPPKVSFTNGGTQGIAYLMDRWRIGSDAGQVNANTDA